MVIDNYIFNEDGTITYPVNLSTREAYLELSNKILGNDIYLLKPIAFRIRGVHGHSVWDQSQFKRVESKESFLTVGYNIRKILFASEYLFRIGKYLKLDAKLITAVAKDKDTTDGNVLKYQRQYYAGDLRWGHPIKKIVAVNGDVPIMFPENPISIDVVIVEGKGNWDANKSNAESELVTFSQHNQIEEAAEEWSTFQRPIGLTSDYYPLFVDFSMSEFIKIKAPIGNQLRYTVHNGMTTELLNKIWQRNRRLEIYGETGVWEN